MNCRLCGSKKWFCLVIFLHLCPLWGGILPAPCNRLQRTPLLLQSSAFTTACILKACTIENFTISANLWRNNLNSNHFSIFCSLYFCFFVAVWSLGTCLGWVFLWCVCIYVAGHSADCLHLCEECSMDWLQCLQILWSGHHLQLDNDPRLLPGPPLPCLPNAHLYQLAPVGKGVTWPFSEHRSHAIRWGTETPWSPSCLPTTTLALSFAISVPLFGGHLCLMSHCVLKLTYQLQEGCAFCLSVYFLQWQIMGCACVSREGEHGRKKLITVMGIYIVENIE